MFIVGLVAVALVVSGLVMVAAQVEIVPPDLQA